MYSYNTLIIHNGKNVNYFLKIKFFLKNIDIFGKQVYNEGKAKIPRARGGLTARPCGCESELAFKLNQRGNRSKNEIWTNCRNCSGRER